jgi:isopenicillin N synthase-like dioxygenase
VLGLPPFYAARMVGVPVIDIEPLRREGTDALAVGRALNDACSEVGFFTIVGHGVDPMLRERLDALARQFFARPESEKREIAMERAGRAWRGWFPLRGELTSGVPDHKEGLYFGAELGADDPRVRAGVPMHGANLFPTSVPGLGAAVLAYMDALGAVGQSVLSGIALGLGLESSWFFDNLTADPLLLLRIFRYPPLPATGDASWSVGEHTDYGLLTILGQDGRAGLEVRTPDGWVAVPSQRDSFVCNLGDMLERLTGGRYRSTAHRVRNVADSDRLSIPFFMDPSWDAPVSRLPIVERPDGNDAASRWDHMSVHGFEGTYGDYIVSKVGRVFPDLAAGVSAGGKS